MDNEIKKNILDLQFQKYLVISSTSILVIVTYFIGVGLAFFSKQILLDDPSRIGALFVISAGILGICSALFFNAVFHIKNILLILRNF
jgi:hypothetical protein